MGFVQRSPLGKKDRGIVGQRIAPAGAFLGGVEELRKDALAGEPIADSHGFVPGAPLPGVVPFPERVGASQPGAVDRGGAEHDGHVGTGSGVFEDGPNGVEPGPHGLGPPKILAKHARVARRERHVDARTLTDGDRRGGDGLLLGHAGRRGLVDHGSEPGAAQEKADLGRFAIDPRHAGELVHAMEAMPLVAAVVQARADPAGPDGGVEHIRRGAVGRPDAVGLMLLGDGADFVEVAGQRAGVELGQVLARRLIERLVVHRFIRPGDPRARRGKPLAEDVEPNAVDPTVAGKQLAKLLDGDLPKRRVEGLVAGGPARAEHDGLPLAVERRPLVELGVAVAHGVVVVDEPQVAAVAGVGDVANEVAFGLEAGGLGVVEDESVDPLVVEDEVRGPGLFEVGHPTIGVHLVAQSLFPLPDRVGALGLVDESGHDRQARRSVPGLVG